MLLKYHYTKMKKNNKKNPKSLNDICFVLTWSLFAQQSPGNSGTRSLVSLKDLCPEDKRRIAKLVEELAR